MLVVAGAVFLLVAGIGAATSYLGDRSDASRSARSQSQGDTLENLQDYARSIGAEQPATAAAPKELLPDVNTMVERLAARLKDKPDDAKGWRMLGWSYFYIGRHKEAVAAYARAVELDPKSEDLKFEYEEAKAKASEIDTGTTAAPARADASGKSGGEPSAEQIAAYQAMPADDRAAAIRSMVDGLAARLESAPRDVEGWTRLMRSRVVLGENEVAATAFRKALDIFKDDTAASERIAAAATELGLKTQ